MTTLVMTNPETAATIAPDLAGEARALVAGSPAAIATAEDAAAAVKDRERLADLRRRVVEYFGPLKSSAHQLHKNICQRERVILDPIDVRDEAIRLQLRTYKIAEDAARTAREAEAAKFAQRAEEDRATHEAAIAELAGDPDLAAAIVEEAVQAPPPVVPLPAPAVPGLKFVQRWKWEIEDVHAIPREFLKVDEVRINGYVRTMKSSGAIPGVRIYSVDEPVR